MQIIINAGGSGTRLWPLSTEACPKQFVSLIDDENFVCKTFQRLAQNFAIDQIWLSTNAKFTELAANSLPNDFVKSHLLLENEKRDTFASILTQTAIVAHFVGESEPLIFIASDHLIAEEDWAKFNSGLVEMAEIVQNKNDFELVIAGIVPKFANTELGYIEINTAQNSPKNQGNWEKVSLEKANLGKANLRKSENSENQKIELESGLNLKNETNFSDLTEKLSTKTPVEKSTKKPIQVASFREKPDLATATKFLASGDFLWNLGYFAWNYKIMMTNLAKYSPELVPIINEIYQKGEVTPELYRQIPKNSIDFALVEKLSKIGAVQMDIDWQDIGNWDVVKDFLPPITTVETGKTQTQNNSKTGNNLKIGKLENTSKNSQENSQENSKNSSQILNPNFIQIDGQNNKIKSQKTGTNGQKTSKIALIGVSNLLVVESDEGILIIDPQKAALVKKAAEYFGKTDENKL